MAQEVTIQTEAFKLLLLENKKMELELKLKEEQIQKLIEQVNALKTLTELVAIK